MEEFEERLETRADDVIALIRANLARQPLFLPEINHNDGTSPEVAAEEEDEDMWGDEGPSQYMEEELEDGVNDFAPDLELDEVTNPQD